jgi:glycerol kinase
VDSGDLKITYGTGAFMLMNVGSRFRLSQHGLLTSIAAGVAGEPVQYYLDGGVYAVGAAIGWLWENLGLRGEASESAEMARSLPSSEGVCFVPALTGLAAPHWTRQVRAAFLGMTATTTPAHLVRAVLESIAFRVLQVVRAMEADAGCAIEAIVADGGVAQNDFLMQYQADLLGVLMRRARTVDMTALGVALLAGLATGFWERGALARERKEDMFEPRRRVPDPREAFQRWEEAVRLAVAFG